MSLCAMLLMGLLFSAETLAFARSKIYTEIALDDNTDPQIQLNFNITLFNLHCDYVSVDVWDVLGTNKQNVTKNMERWQTDGNGIRKSFSGRNRDTRELKYEVHEQTLQEMHEDGVHAILLEDPEHFEAFMAEHEMTMINFFAPWCMWCQRLHPTWEKFAEEVEAEGMPVGVASVDCQAHPQLCIKEGVGAFPTLKWYEGGKYIAPDYKADRTVASLISFATRKLQLNEKLKNWHDNDKHVEVKKMRELYSTPDNPGCQISGTLMGKWLKEMIHLTVIL
jgi:protein disulfide-isomerase-like protein